MSAKIRVLVVDDHAVVREGLWALLGAKSGIEVVGEACNGEEAVIRAQQLQPDVIIMDLQMPVKNGVSAIRDIRELGLATRILVLTNAIDDVTVIESLRAGANGYLLKTVLPGELVEAITKVHKGQSPITPEVVPHLFSNVSGNQKETTLRKVLTERELEIVKLIAQGHDNQTIGTALNISIRTVGTHISNILEKTATTNRTQLALIALREGLVSLYDSGPRSFGMNSST